MPSSTGDSGKVTTVVATPGQGPDRPQEVSYTDIKVIGNGSFGVVYQARLIDSQEMVAIKKVLQDKRFKVCLDRLTLPDNYSKAKCCCFNVNFASIKNIVVVFGKCIGLSLCGLKYDILQFAMKDIFLHTIHIFCISLPFALPHCRIGSCKL